MKRLVIQSSNTQEDAQAAYMIDQEMKRGDAKQVVWHADIGKKIKKIDTVGDQLAYWGDRVVELEATVGKIKTLVKDMQETINRQKELSYERFRKVEGACEAQSLQIESILKAIMESKERFILPEAP